MGIKEIIPKNESSQFSMTKNDNETWTLKTNHKYYYQVQVQLYVSKVSFGNFIVRSEKAGITVERTHTGNSFKILPKIVEKWLSRVPVAESEEVIRGV